MPMAWPALVTRRVVVGITLDVRKGLGQGLFAPTASTSSLTVVVLVHRLSWEGGGFFLALREQIVVLFVLR